MMVSKKRNKIKNNFFIHKFLEFCYFLVFELRNQHDCVEEQEEDIMNGVYIMGNEKCLMRLKLMNMRMMSFYQFF